MKQLRNRQRNMAANPQVEAAVCPVCKGTDWAITDVHIRHGVSTGSIAALRILGATVVGLGFLILVFIVYAHWTAHSMSVF